MWRWSIALMLGCSAQQAGTDTDAGTDSDTDSDLRDCANPDAAWLLCEDFERGAGDFDTWLAASDFLDAVARSDRGRIDLSSAQAHTGGWSVVMPAAASSGYQGSELNWWSCQGAPAFNCQLDVRDELYFRAWVRFADDHRAVHHFLSLEGSQPDDFWPHGTAGCLPNGALDMGTTVDFRADSHASFFYTYTPDMACDTNCGNYADVDAICAECADKGLPTCDTVQQCCWGNVYEPETPVMFPVGRWFCLEMAMHANTVGSKDGWMAYWVDDTLAHRQEGMAWRTSPTLGLSRANLRHYIAGGDASQSNQVWFDDVVVSASRIGCR